MKLRDILLVLLVVIIWGANFTAIKFGLQELPPMLLSAMRFLVVALPAVFFVPFPKTSILNVLGVGVFLGIFKFGLLFIAMRSDASAGLSSLILQAQVFFTIGLSVLFYKEILTRRQLVGGGITIIGFSSFFLISEGNITHIGLALILAAAFCWAISNIIMKNMKDVNLLHFIVWVSIVPPIPLFILSYFIESDDPVGLITSMTKNGWLSVLYVGYISTLVAFSIWGYLLKTYFTALVAPFALLVPFVGITVSKYPA